MLNDGLLDEAVERGAGNSDGVNCDTKYVIEFFMLVNDESYVEEPEVSDLLNDQEQGFFCDGENRVLLLS